MGKKIKVKKEPSEFLLKLIDEANEAIRTAQVTIKEKLLSVYDQCIGEGFNYKQTRKIMKDKIKVSESYMREILPVEAKQSHSRRDIKALSDVINKDLHCGEPQGQTINITSESSPPLQTPPTPTITLGATQEDIDAINKMKDEEEEEEETTPTKVEPSLDEKMTTLTHENFKLEEQLKEARIRIKELEIKNAELENELSKYRRLEQIRLEAQRKSLESWKVPGDRPT